MSITFGSLFTGIGGLDLGLERSGMTCRWQVEIDGYCNRILAARWPFVRRLSDVRHVCISTVAAVDLICGGFPCQPVSNAGAKRGPADIRWLWPEFARVVDEVRPRFVLVENVPGLLTSSGGAEIITDLATLGYDAEWGCVSAADVGAPHIRKRVFIFAYARSERVHKQCRWIGWQGWQRTVFTDGNGSLQHLSDADCERLSIGKKSNGTTEQFGFEASRRSHTDGLGINSKCDMLEESGDERQERGIAERDWWSIEPDVGRMAHGVPKRVDRLRGLGNAVVPQVAEWIGQRILEAIQAKQLPA